MPRSKPDEPWCGNGYSVRLTETQRIALAKMGGGQWLREQINKAIGDSLDAQDQQRRDGSRKSGCVLDSD